MKTNNDGRLIPESHTDRELLRCLVLRHAPNAIWQDGMQVCRKHVGFSRLPSTELELRVYYALPVREKFLCTTASSYLEWVAEIYDIQGTPTLEMRLVRKSKQCIVPETALRFPISESSETPAILVIPA